MYIFTNSVEIALYVLFTCGNAGGVSWVLGEPEYFAPGNIAQHRATLEKSSAVCNFCRNYGQVRGLKLSSISAMCTEMQHSSMQCNALEVQKYKRANTI